MFPPQKKPPAGGPSTNPGGPPDPFGPPPGGSPPPPGMPPGIDPFGGGGMPPMGMAPGMPKPGQGMDPMQAMMQGLGPDPSMTAGAPQDLGPPMGPDGFPVGGSMPPMGDGGESMGGVRLAQSPRWRRRNGWRHEPRRPLRSTSGCPRPDVPGDRPRRPQHGP